MRQLRFGVTVEDVDHWTAEHRAQAETSGDGGTYDDWAAEQLEQAMHEAGNAFIAAHHDLFRGDLA
jgi:hypothetical protein